MTLIDFSAVAFRLTTCDAVFFLIMLFSLLSSILFILATLCRHAYSEDHHWEQDEGVSKRTPTTVVNRNGKGGSGGDGGDGDEINDCLQRGDCGIFPICSYSFSYECRDGDEESDAEEPCDNYNDDSGDDDDYGRGESSFTKRISGNIALLKNGMDSSSSYKWEIIGQEGKIYEDYEKPDDSDLRTYKLPRKSCAYFDTTVHFRQRIRLHNSGQVVDTVTSSDSECTVHEACRYLAKVCQSSFAFSSSPSISELRRKCKEYSRACSYFVYEPDMFRESSTSAYPVRYGNLGSQGSVSPSRTTAAGGSDNGNGDNSDNVGARSPSSSSSSSSSTSLAVEAALERTKMLSNQCIVDCLWNYYPSKYLPADKGKLLEKAEGLWILRRNLLGMGLKLDECSDVRFVDDRINLFRTNEDEDGEFSFIEREANSTHQKEVAIIAILTVIVIVLLAGIVVYWVGRFKNNPWSMGVGSSSNVVSGSNHYSV